MISKDNKELSPAEEVYELLHGDNRETVHDTEYGEVAMKSLSTYSYFDLSKIGQSVQIPPGKWTKAKKLIADQKIQLVDINAGENRYSSAMLGQAFFDAEDQYEEFSFAMLFDRSKVLRTNCDCAECIRNNWRQEVGKCEYVAAGLLLLQEHHEELGYIDATNSDGLRVMKAFQLRNMQQKVSGNSEARQYELCPRVFQKEGKLNLSFKYGCGKLFVIKNLSEFSNNMKKELSGQYGSATVLEHRQELLNESGRKWLQFLQRCVQEEEKALLRIAESDWYSDRHKLQVGNSLELFGWRLDEIYEAARTESIEFDNRDSAVKGKQILTCTEENPRFSIHIDGSVKRNEPFHGVKVSGNLPQLHQGINNYYYIQDKKLIRTDDAFYRVIMPLRAVSDENSFSFFIGRQQLSSFYHNVLPQLETYADIVEKSPENIAEAIIPQERFQFFLDVLEGYVSCKAKVLYGDRNFELLPPTADESAKSMEIFRNHMAEWMILNELVKWFPDMDDSGTEFRSNGEDSFFEIATSGVEALMNLGEVHCTKRFQNMNTIKPVKLSVGVSVSEGMLDLSIMTDDLSGQELLDILQSYKTKKKYYRLKNGSFVDLQDEKLKAFAEMMDNLHISNKEFLRERIHIPAYRALYMDKLFEEHQDLYQSRDQHFRQIVKSFKTVNESDFEEPDLLKTVMRSYQKQGYKWLRTLESYGFGGILADDMGLGKTLQMISVLLSAVQEKRNQLSIVVCPASLVYNWKEEFSRFAPDLKAVCVAGTAGEREALLKNAAEADVLITSYDLLRRDIAMYENMSFTYAVIDEAQYIKNHTTNAAKAVKALKSKYKFALTGTPIENRLSELWSIFDFLMPGFLYNYDTFRRELETPIVKHHDEEAAARLQHMVSPFILRRLKQQVLKDLPEKLEEKQYVKMESAQRKLYDAQVVHMKQMLASQNEAEFNSNRIKVLAELTRLRQICCDPSLFLENYRDSSAKLEACLDLINRAIESGHRMLLFSQFTSMLQIIQNRLIQMGIPYYCITGSTSKEERARLVKQFNADNVPVFLISLKAGGVGLNLTGADLVIHYDPWWNAAAQNQATDRTHRIGQTKTVTVYQMVVKDTIEEKIQKLQETKLELADQIIGGENGQITSMSKEDILALL